MARNGTSGDIKLHSLFLEITGKTPYGYEILVRKKHTSVTTSILFDPTRKVLIFNEENSLTNFLRLHEYQFRKILHNKRIETFYPGFQLHFVIWENKNMLDFNNNRKVITFDNRENDIRCYIDDELVPEQLIYADGAFSEKSGQGAYAVLVKAKADSGEARLFGQKIEKATDSNQVELLAALKGLELTAAHKVVRLHTDSRYVKKGITEWIFYWQVNDWTTANGTQAKHIDLWKRFLDQTKGRIVQFVWIKGHSDRNPENKLCDYYAKSLLNAKR